MARAGHDISAVEAYDVRTGGEGHVSSANVLQLQLQSHKPVSSLKQEQIILITDRISFEANKKIYAWGRTVLR